MTDSTPEVDALPLAEDAAAVRDDDTGTVLVRGRPWLRQAYEQHRRELATLRVAETAVRSGDVDAFLRKRAIC